MINGTTIHSYLGLEAGTVPMKTILQGLWPSDTPNLGTGQF